MIGEVMMREYYFCGETMTCPGHPRNARIRVERIIMSQDTPPSIDVDKEMTARR